MAIVFNSPLSDISLKSQIDSLQTTLASLNQQVIILQENIQEREQTIAQLRSQTTSGKAKPRDHTLTIIGALINLYRFAFPPQSNMAGSFESSPGKVEG